MLKKLLRVLKAVIIGLIWTAAFFYICRVLLIYVWHFDIFSRNQWIVISGYWNNNGVIMSASDYLFFLTLFALMIVWVLGWRVFYKMNYLKFLLAPVNFIINYQLNKYESDDTRVVIKNLKVAEKKSVEDIIQERMKQEKASEVKESQQLRKNISEKIIRRKE